MADIVFERKTLQKGEMVFKEGDEANTAFLVQAGEVAIYKTIDGRPKVLATLGQGAIFGEMGLIDSKPRMASARMSKGGTIVVVTRQLFEEKLNKSDPFIRGLLKILAENLRKVQAAKEAEPAPAAQPAPAPPPAAQPAAAPAAGQPRAGAAAKPASG